MHGVNCKCELHEYKLGYLRQPVQGKVQVECYTLAQMLTESALNKTNSAENPMETSNYEDGLFAAIFSQMPAVVYLAGNFSSKAILQQDLFSILILGAKLCMSSNDECSSTASFAAGQIHRTR